MNTNDETARNGRGGPSPFTEEEIAEVSEGLPGDPELDGIDPAEIEDRASDLETSFEKLLQKGKKLPPERIRTIVESVLFVSDKPLALDQLYEATGIDQVRILDALEKLSASLREGISGIVLSEVAGGWQLRTDAASAEYVRRFLRVKPQRLTRAAVETLAIVAYRQPVTRPEIEEIRGVDSGAVLKALLDRRLLKILGKKEEVGRPILYGTTREFLEFFALKDLASLPTLREFQELTQEHQEIVERESTPVETAESVSQLADPGFMQRMEAGHKDSEVALEELEKAMAAADSRTQAAATFLNPPKPPVGAGEVGPEEGT
jgi:segregation and condensation protein B